MIAGNSYKTHMMPTYTTQRFILVHKTPSLDAQTLASIPPSSCCERLSNNT